MEDQELMAFINRILANDSLFKGPRVLSELERILAEQGAPLRQQQLVQQAREGYREGKAMSDQRGSAPLTERDLAIALERERLRVKREEELANQGRC